MRVSLFVTDLSPRNPSPILSTFMESAVQFALYDPVITLGLIDELKTLYGMLMSKIFHKAKATWSFSVLVETHDQALDGTYDGHGLIDLQLRGVKTQVAHIDGGGPMQSWGRNIQI